MDAYKYYFNIYLYAKRPIDINLFCNLHTLLFIFALHGKLIISAITLLRPLSLCKISQVSNYLNVTGCPCRQIRNIRHGLYMFNFFKRNGLLKFFISYLQCSVLWVDTHRTILSVLRDYYVRTRQYGMVLPCNFSRNSYIVTIVIYEYILIYCICLLNYSTMLSEQQNTDKNTSGVKCFSYTSAQGAVLTVPT